MIFFVAIKIIFSFILFYFLSSKLDCQAVGHIIGITNSMQALVFGGVTILFQAVLGGKRLSLILELYGIQLNTMTSIRSWLIGGFFSQTMISFVGGDAMRVWYLNRRSIPTKTATSAILLDRIVGFIALIFIFLLVFTPLMSIIIDPLMRYGITLLLVGGLSAIAIFMLLAVFFPYYSKAKFHKAVSVMIDLCSNGRYLFLSYKKSIVVFLLSITSQFLNTITLYGIFQFYNIDIDFYWCMVLAIPALLISMLPISIAGWGVRETAMMMGFSILGIPSDKILAVSITFGLSLCVAGLPGLFIFLFERKRIGSTVSSHLQVS